MEEEYDNEDGKDATEEAFMKGYEEEAEAEFEGKAFDDDEDDDEEEEEE